MSHLKSYPVIYPVSSQILGINKKAKYALAKYCPEAKSFFKYIIY